MINPDDFRSTWRKELDNAGAETEEPKALKPRVLVRVICAMHGLDLQPRLEREELDPTQPTTVYGCPDPDCPVATYIDIRTVPDTQYTEEAK